MGYLIAAWLGGSVMLLAALAAHPIIRKYGSARLKAWWERNVIADVSDWRTDI